MTARAVQAVSKGATGGPTVPKSVALFKSLVFLGTSSAVPTKYRNVSSYFLELSNGSCWLFDCGEGTYQQLVRVGSGAERRITKVFITHLHGDHCFGLPTLLMSAAEHRTNNPDVLEIYGPPETAEFVRESLIIRDAPQCEATTAGCGIENNATETSTAAAVELGPRYQRLNYPYRVTEIGAHGDYPGGNPPPPRPFSTSSSLHPDELSPIFVKRSADAHGNVSSGVSAATNGVEHEQEASSPSNVTTGEANKLISYDVFNAETIGSSYCAVQAAPLSHPIASLGYVVTEPSGCRGVFLGDTCESQAAIPIAKGADFVVHEATFGEECAHLAVPRGHSTAKMAGTFAQSVGSRQLILTHFSARYPPRAVDPEACDRLVSEASSCFAGPVVMAEDFSTVDLTCGSALQ